MKKEKKKRVVVCLLLSSLAHSNHGICSFFGDLHGRLDLELVPKLFQFSTVRRVFPFVVLLLTSTADVACPRFVHADETYMAFPNHVVEVFHRLVSTAPYALGDKMDASRVISQAFYGSPPNFS